MNHVTFLFTLFCSIRQGFATDTIIGSPVTMKRFSCSPEITRNTIYTVITIAYGSNRRTLHLLQCFLSFLRQVLTIESERERARERERDREREGEREGRRGGGRERPEP